MSAPVSADFLQEQGYDVTGLLGQGGSGIVFRGRRVADNRPVAIKVLLAPEDSTQHERFGQEARILLDLESPNLVKVIQVDSSRERSFIVMELVRGGSLRSLLRKSKISLDQALKIAIGCCVGLATCHARGIWHRDIKPENILLDAGGEPKISDLGIAKDSQQSLDLTDTGALIGSPVYMAPERLLGKCAGAASDIYSLGVVCYELLSGGPPFASKFLPELFAQVTQSQPPPLRQKAPHVDAELASLIDSLLVRDPARRPSSETTGARLQTLRARLANPAPPRRWWGWAIALSLTLVLTGVYRWHRPDHTAAIASAPATPVVVDEEMKFINSQTQPLTRALNGMLLRTQKCHDLVAIMRQGDSKAGAARASALLEEERLDLATLRVVVAELEALTPEHRTQINFHWFLRAHFWLYVVSSESRIANLQYLAEGRSPSGRRSVPRTSQLTFEFRNLIQLLVNFSESLDGSPDAAARALNLLMDILNVCSILESPGTAVEGNGFLESSAFEPFERVANPEASRWIDAYSLCLRRAALSGGIFASGAKGIAAAHDALNKIQLQHPDFRATANAVLIRFAHRELTHLAAAAARTKEGFEALFQSAIDRPLAEVQRTVREWRSKVEVQLQDALALKKYIFDDKSFPAPTDLLRPARLILHCFIYIARIDIHRFDQLQKAQSGFAALGTIAEIVTWKTAVSNFAPIPEELGVDLQAYLKLELDAVKTIPPDPDRSSQMTIAAVETAMLISAHLDGRALWDRGTPVGPVANNLVENFLSSLLQIKGEPAATLAHAVRFAWKTNSWVYKAGYMEDKLFTAELARLGNVVTPGRSTADFAAAFADPVPLAIFE